MFEVPSLSSSPNHNDNLKYFIDQANERIAKASQGS